MSESADPDARPAPIGGRRRTVAVLLVVVAAIVTGLAAAALPAALRKLILLPVLLGLAGGGVVFGVEQLTDTPLRSVVAALAALVILLTYAAAGSRALARQAEAELAANPMAKLLLDQVRTDPAAAALDRPGPLPTWLQWRAKPLTGDAVALPVAAGLFVLETALAIAAGWGLHRRLSGGR